LQTKYHSAFIGFGSNFGDGKKILASAWKRLGEEESVSLTLISSPFLSDPVDMDSDNRFTNCVGRIETSLTPHELLTKLLTIEKEFGRTRSHPGGKPEDRSLDLDLLYFSKLSIDEDGLVVPHPEVSKRLFTLVPMVEIEPTYVDPLTQKTVVSMCKCFYAQMRDGTIKEQKIERTAWQSQL